MDTTSKKQSTRAELLAMIRAAQAQLEELNKWKPGDRVYAAGTVQSYADEEGNVLVDVEGLSAPCTFHEENLVSQPAFETEAPASVAQPAPAAPAPAAPPVAPPVSENFQKKLTEISSRCFRLLGDSGKDKTPLDAIEAAIRMAEEAKYTTHAHADMDLPAASQPEAAQQGPCFYAVVRRETGRPNSRFDLTGREFFYGYFSKEDCEAYRLDCETVENSWGVRGDVYACARFCLVAPNPAEATSHACSPNGNASADEGAPQHSKF